MKHLKLSLGSLALLLVLGQSRAMAAVSCSSCAYITGDDTVYAWEPTANTLTTVDIAPKGGIDSLIFDKSGNIIYNIASGPIYLYDTTANTNTLLATLGTGGSSLGDMALEPSGQSILVAGRGDNTIYRIDLTSKASSVFYKGLRPDGIIYDTTGKLFAVLNQSEVAQFDPVTGAILKQIQGLQLADGMTFSTTTLNLYVGSNNGGFYTIPTDLSGKTFTSLPGNAVIDGVGTAGHFLYLIQWGDCADTSGCGKAFQYDLTANQVSVLSQPINLADDIAPLSGLGSLAGTVSVPTFTPPAGTYATPQSVTIQTATPGASIFYTADGSIPTANSTPYTSPIPVNANLTIKAFATKTGMLDSGVATAVYIISAPPPPPTAQIQFNPTSYSVNENAGLATITVTRTVDSSLTSTVHFASSNGTATAGQDYLGVSGTLTFNPGDTSATFDVPLIDDTLVESNETVLLTLSNPTNATLGTSNAVLTIVDNDTTSPPPPAPAPFISQLVPNSAPVNWASDINPMRIIGTGFVSNSQVLWNGSSSGITILTSASTEIDVIVSHNLLASAGQIPVMVVNPGNVQSNASPFTVRTPGSGYPPPFIGIPSASPNPTYITSTNLSVQGGTLTGGALTYTWSLTGANPSTLVKFTSSNADGSLSVATFPPTTGTVTYHIKATVLDKQTSFAVDSVAVDVVVIQNATSIAVTPKTQTIGVNMPLNLTATVKDQWGITMVGQTPTWANSAGSLSTLSGVSTSFSASDANIPPVTITAVDNPAFGVPLKDFAKVTIVVSGAGSGGDISNAKAYPVPWKSNGGDPFIHFTGLASGTKIRLFTVTGHIVQTLNSPDGSDIAWDIKNANFDRVASGVYMFIIEANGQKKQGKIVIIQ